ncbi:LysM peptidoglycan-binding domain-containing protein [Flammeovirgaceae bacterium SG7u.111]|nr:LysM peptidoglycan-binding domain-containing protein [Flammeovirgaceae bacterium SG7u.132]WPO34879.1 LysM peptidoglycan-binding domain-containing protein [Flammeovirgaceae bacterium SG7u.111]
MKNSKKLIALMSLAAILLLNMAFRGGTEPTEIDGSLSVLVEPSTPTQLQYQYPIISNRQVKVYQGDTIIHVMANGIPAIIARPGQNVPKLLASTNMSRNKFAKINDTPPLFIDELIAGAVYYLKNKKSKAPVPFHYVQPKETAWDIAQMYGIKKSKLLKKNRMSTGDELQLGRKMFLQSNRKKKTPVEFNKDIKPDPKAAGPWARFIDGDKGGTKDEQPLEKITRIDNQAASKLVIDPNAKFHTVREGETIFDISKAYNVTVLELKEWNNLDYNNINMKPGEVIIVKGDKLPQNSSYGNTATTTGGGADPLTPSIILKPGGNAPDSAFAYGATQNGYGYGTPAGAATGTAAGASTASQMHTVQKGEGIYGIARQYNISPKDLMAWNSMDNNTLLEVGQQIYVADPSSAISAYNTGTPAGSYNNTGATGGYNAYGAAATGGVAAGTTGSAIPVDQTHIVEKGETLYRISRKYSVSVNDIMDWNGLASTDINAGQELLVSAPIGAAGAAPAGASASFNTGSYSTPAGGYDQVAGAASASAAVDYNQVAGAAAGASTTLPAYDQQAGVASAYNQPAGAQTNTGAAGAQVAAMPNYNQVAGGAAATVPPGAATTTGQGQHIVQNGDDIYTLSARYNVTVENLRKWNNIPFGTDIQPGQVLVVEPQGVAGAADVQVAAGATGAAAGAVDYNQANGAAGGATAIPSANNTATGGQVVGYTAPTGNSQIDYAATAGNYNQAAGAAATSAASVGNGKTHIVQKGETLYAISRLYNVKVSDLMSMNGMSSGEINTGQELIVSGVGSSAGGSVHTVQKNETLYSISRKYKISLDELKRLNGKSSNEIVVGETLKVQ